MMVDFLTEQEYDQPSTVFHKGIGSLPSGVLR